MLPLIYKEKRTVTPEKAQKILAKKGVKITADEAEIILEFLYKIGNLSVSKTINAAKKANQTLVETKQPIPKFKTKNR